MTTVMPPQADTVRVPAEPAAGMRAALAGALFRRVTGRLGVRVAYPDGTVTGDEGPTMIVRRPQALLARLGAHGLIGFGEAYQAGDWDSDDLVRLLTIFAEQMATLVPPRLQFLRRIHGPRAPRADRNTVQGSRRNVHRHYDVSNDLFALFLDPSMCYSSALFDGFDEDLTVAQLRKIDRLLDATRVRAGSRVLEIGTGWGELAIRAAQRGASVVSVTLSAEQRALALRRAAEAGVVDRVDVRLRDYREISPVHGGYDAVLSVEMIEAVGHRYWPCYAAALSRQVAPDGRVGLQMITMAHSRMLATRDTYTWIHKYIFPGGLLPSVDAVAEVFALADFTVCDRLDFGAHYAETLRRWRSAFLAQSASLGKLGFDETFRRTWNFYLAYCEAGFNARYIDVCQLVLRRAA